MLDIVHVKHALSGSKSRPIGLNCHGVITPERKIGIMPGQSTGATRLAPSPLQTYEALAQTVTRLGHTRRA